MAWGIDDLVNTLSNGFNDTGADAATDAAIDAGTAGGPAAIDTANTAFLPGVSDAIGAFGNVRPELSDFGVTGSRPDFGGGGAPSFTPTDLGGAVSTDRGSAVASLPLQPGSGDMGADQQGIEQTMPAPQSVPGAMTPPPIANFREALGSIPGKWYNALSQAPTNVANYVANNPVKTMMGVGSLAANAYGAFHGGSANAAGAVGKPAAMPSFASPAPTPRGGGVDYGQKPYSPILTGDSRVSRGSGLMGVR